MNITLERNEHILFQALFGSVFLHPHRQSVESMEKYSKRKRETFLPHPFPPFPAIWRKNKDTMAQKHHSQRTYTATHFSLNSANPASCPHLSRTYTYRAAVLPNEWDYMSLASVSDSRQRNSEHVRHSYIEIYSNTFKT